MIQKWSVEELEKMNIEEIMSIVVEAEINDVHNIRNLIKALVRKEVLFQHQLLCMLIKEQLNTGIKKQYSLSELESKLPWKKSQLSVKLQAAITEGILIHERKKYYLNEHHTAFKRMWIGFKENSINF